MLKTKTFDCVEMKREGGRRIYQRVKDMTPQEELAYWKARSTELGKKIKAAKRRGKR